MNITYESQGTMTYGVYQIQPNDVLDTLGLGMLTNNKIPGLAATQFTQMDNQRYIKFNVTAKVPVSQFFTGQVNRKRLLGVGISIPGLISPDGRRISFAPTLGIRNAPLYPLIRGIDYPVHVENDGTASGHAESVVRRQKESLAYLSLEEGIGGAVLIDGLPYPGSGAKSGEFGHICVEPGGLRCSCGRCGCLEAYCSAARIESCFGVSLEEFFRGVEEHRPDYEALLFDMLRHLAIGINSIHMVLDCDVVLGGFLSEYLQPWLPALRQYVLAGNPFAENADFVQLSTLRRHITSLGAALFFVREFVTGV